MAESAGIVVALLEVYEYILVNDSHGEAVQEFHSLVKGLRDLHFQRSSSLLLLSLVEEAGLGT